MKGCGAMAAYFERAYELISGFFMQIIMAFADIRIADIIDIVIQIAFIYNYMQVFVLLCFFTKKKHTNSNKLVCFYFAL